MIPACVFLLIVFLGADTSPLPSAARTTAPSSAPSMPKLEVVFRVGAAGRYYGFAGYSRSATTKDKPVFFDCDTGSVSILTSLADVKKAPPGDHKCEPFVATAGSIARVIALIRAPIVVGAGQAETPIPRAANAPSRIYFHNNSTRVVESVDVAPAGSNTYTNTTVRVEAFRETKLDVPAMPSCSIDVRVHYADGAIVSTSSIDICASDTVSLGG